MRWLLLISMLLTVAAPLRAQRGFPDAWVGAWSGELRTISGSAAAARSLALRIDRLPGATAYRWQRIIDGDTTAITAHAQLVVRDSDLGFYAFIGIAEDTVEATFADGSLLSIIAEGDRVREERYALRGDTLIVELTWYAPQGLGVGAPPRRAQGDTTATVQAYRVSVRQRALLTRRDWLPLR
jgi:hypothetical protein